MEPVVPRGDDSDARFIRTEIILVIRFRTKAGQRGFGADDSHRSICSNDFLAPSSANELNRCRASEPRGSAWHQARELRGLGVISAAA